MHTKGSLETIVQKMIVKQTKQDSTNEKALRNGMCIMYALYRKEVGLYGTRTFAEYLVDEVPLPIEPTDIDYLTLIDKLLVQFGANRFLEKIKSVIRDAPTVAGLKTALIKWAGRWLDHIERVDDGKEFTIETDIIGIDLALNPEKLPLGLKNISPQATFTAYQYGRKIQSRLDLYARDKDDYCWIIEVKSKAYDKGLAGQVMRYKKTLEEYLRGLGSDKRKIRIAVIAPKFNDKVFMQFEHPREHKFFIYDMETESIKEYKIPDRFGKVIAFPRPPREAA